MTKTNIDADKLKTIRKARKIGRPKLARLAGITERQIARMEGAAPVREGLSQDIMLRISDALQVPLGTLTGELPIGEQDLQPAAKSTCKNGCCG